MQEIQERADNNYITAVDNDYNYMVGGTSKNNIFNVNGTVNTLDNMRIPISFVTIAGWYFVVEYFII